MVYRFYLFMVDQETVLLIIKILIQSFLTKIFFMSLKLIKEALAEARHRSETITITFNII